MSLFTSSTSSLLLFIYLLNTATVSTWFEPGNKTYPVALSSFHPPPPDMSLSESLANASKPQLTYMSLRTSFAQLMVCRGAVRYVGSSV